MLSKIIFITSFLFAAIYPLCFWISARDPLKNRFHAFHLGLPVIIAGLLAFFSFFIKLPFSVAVAVLVWFVVLFLVAALEWSKPSPGPVLVTIPCVLGIVAYAGLHVYWIGPAVESYFISLIGGFILCASLYSMNLGHWYLNVHGLPIQHLRNAVYVFGMSLVIRLLWDMVYIFQATVFYGGESVPLYYFMTRIDGLFVWIAIFFGTLFPLASLYFVLETIRLKNTQSATGILYVILSGVLLGDITYKYYLLKFGLAL